jgi:hypothetical protein
VTFDSHWLHSGSGKSIKIPLFSSQSTRLLSFFNLLTLLIMIPTLIRLHAHHKAAPPMPKFFEKGLTLDHVSRDQLFCNTLSEN